MRKTLILTLMLIGITPTFAQKKLRDYVNPMVGTKSMGHTFPGPCAPFGAIQLSPDTEMILQNIDGVYQPKTYEYCAGYQYDDPTIVGFSHTHLNGTGHSDLGDILVMPTVGEIKLDMGTAEDTSTGYRSNFSHDREHAELGYYSVMLDDYNIKVELTATERTGVHRYTYPEGVGHVVLDLDYGIYNYDGKVLMSNLRVEDEYTVTGYRITRGWSRMNYTYFAIKFSKPIKNYGCQNKETLKYVGWWRKFDMKDNFPEMFGQHLTAFFDFDFTEEDNTLEMKVAISPVDCLGALANLEAESANKTFDQVKAEVQDKWEKELSTVEIEADENRKNVFYTAMYRTMINPSVYQDVDGRYRGIDHNIHTADSGETNYTVFSVWDTYRAQHPLMNILKRDRSKQFVNSMLNHYKQSPHKMLPVWSLMGNENWCMIGYHGVSVVADAVAKGLDIDKDLALQACVNSANLDYYDGIGEYKEYGYLPSDFNKNSASITLEYSYDDWAIAKLAESMGKKDIADTFYKRAESFNNIFDPTLGFARPKDKEGVFKKDFNLLETHDMGFIEGNSWNYSFYVPHDPNKLIDHMYGDKRFVQRLDSLFTMHLPAEYFQHTEDINEEGLMGNYVHGNEPSHHVPYLYAWTSQPWKSQSRLHEIMNKMYKNKVDGLCGNDDCGQMSAWYIFSSMGFYPVAPGSDQYVLGSPNAQELKINLDNGKTFTIKAPNMSDKNVYVKSVKLNGEKYDKAYITHDDIMNGGELFFEMSSKPNKNRVFNEDQKPYSMTQAKK